MITLIIILRMRKLVIIILCAIGVHANALCVHWIETGQVASCGYDCAADGFGH